MSAIVQAKPIRPRKLALLWIAPLQAASLFTVWAIGNGGETLRAWILAAMLWLMSLPLLAGLEGTLVAMMVFEPLRGLIRRSQYLIVNYSNDDPIHVLTPLVTIMALAVVVKKERLSMLWRTPLAGWVSILGLIFFLEIFNPLQGSLYVGLTGALFILVPLVWFYFGQSINENFVHKTLLIMIVLGILGSLYGVYQLSFGYPAFEQYWLDNTDFYASIAVGHVTRALGTFSSAEEWGRYTEFGAIAALGFAIMDKRRARQILWFVCTGALVGGVLLSGQRTAVFGMIFGMASLIMLGARNLKGAAARLAMMLIPAVLAVVFIAAPTDDEVWSKGDNEGVSTVLSHTQKGTLKPADEDSLQIRFENWGDLITTVIPYRPLGAGIGAGSLGDARSKRDSELPPIDNFILVLAVACGIPGALVLTWILTRSTWLSFWLARNSETGTQSACLTRIIAAIMPALFLNNIFGLTLSIYSVAPIAWLLIGWVSAETLRRRTADERERLII